MIKLIITFLATLFSCNAVFAQTISPGSGSFSGSADISSNPSIRLNGSYSRSQATREADWFNPKDFGAKNNSSSTANSVLGITTLSGLVGYSVNGVLPYSWAGTFPFGNLFNLGISSAVTTSTSTTTTLTFSTTAAANSSAPDQTGTNPDLYIPTTSSGIYQDMIVTSSGSCITNSTTLVEWYVPTTGEVRLSAPTAANCNGQTLTFKPRWFSNISVGMYVCAGIVACPNTSQVTAISSSAPWTVTISAASASQSLTPISSTNFVGSQITFWSQWTSAQAQALTMDYLAIQAAEKAAEATSGGRVWLGYGTYYTNGPIIFPTGALSVSMTGDGRGEQGQTPQPAAITAIADLGPGQFAVSCGEPTEGITNGRGIYANGGTFCYGDWSQFTLTTPTPNVSCGSGVNTCGYRPQINGLPIAMNGFQQGPRRYERMIQESGFNVGNQFQGDHTHFDEVDFSNNFINLRLNDPMSNLYFDIDAVQLKAGGASYIGLSIAPAAVFQGLINKAWIADEPYLIMGEAGNNNIFVDTIINMPNFEGAGCASIFDDNITLAGGGQARSVQNLTINGGEFQGGNTNYAPVGGCTWNAFIDLYGAYGLVIDDISNGSFLNSSGSAISGATSIVRLTQVGSVISSAGQGVFLRGAGIGNVASILTAANQELVTGPGSGGSNFAIMVVGNKLQLKIPEFGAEKFIT